MAHPLINRDLYEAIVRFDESEEARDYYYKVMETVTEKDGKPDTVRNQIRRRTGCIPGTWALTPGTGIGCSTTSP